MKNSQSLIKKSGKQVWRRVLGKKVIKLKRNL